MQKLKKFKHKHHVIPKHMGGTDNPENIVELTPRQHAKAHLNLYKKFGKKEDLCAFYLMTKDPRGPQILSSLGGKKQGKKIKNLDIFKKYQILYLRNKGLCLVKLAQKSVKN